MSAACFTCSRTSEALSPLTNSCYWDVLRSLLLPALNIEHLCVPSPNLHLCVECEQMLYSISVFRSDAITSAQLQLQRCKEMDTLSSKEEIVNVDIKQEILEEEDISAQKSKLESLHEEVMLDPKEEVMVKIEPDITNYTEITQNEFDDSRLSGDATVCDDEGQQTFVDISGVKVSPSERDSDEESYSDRVNSRSPEPEASTSIFASRKSTKPPEPPSSTEKITRCITTDMLQNRPLKRLRGTRYNSGFEIKGTSYYTKVINKEDLRAYREHQRNSERFQKAKYKCSTCITTFSSPKAKAEHRLVYHSKRKGFIECVVCEQTMPAKVVAKHVASHFEFVVCSVCGLKTKEVDTMKKHVCGATKVPKKSVKNVDKVYFDPYNFF